MNTDNPSPEGFNAMPSDLEASRTAPVVPAWTPGPWRICDNAILSECLNDYGNWIVCRIDRGDNPTTPQDAANAHLIASAPALYAACEAVSEYRDLIAQNYPDLPGLIRGLDAARLALARARGGVA